MNKANILKLLRLYMIRAQAELLLYNIKKINERRTRKCAVRPILQKRRSKGYFNNLVQEMRLQDTESFTNFHRMNKETFDQLLSVLGPSLKSAPCRQSEQITMAERLSLTLRYLASGDSMKSIGVYGFRIGASTTSNIIRETCHLIWEKMSFVFPTVSEKLWEDVANEFNTKWDFPNCLGAIDGKHVVIQAFPNSNSQTFNYKHSQSIILLAVCDAEYKFILVDIGALGHNNDENMFTNSTLENYITTNSQKLCFPAPKNLPGSNQIAPFVFAADEAFPLLANLMRPFPDRDTGNLSSRESIFNNRLSKARRVIDNSFGILANRWRIYRKPIIARETTVINIIQATLCLHNWLRINNTAGYVTDDLVDTENIDGTITPGTWRETVSEGMMSLGRTGSNNPTQQSDKIREDFTNYFSST